MSKWTIEREQLIVKLWEDGKSASEIAAVMDFPTTRSAIIGKLSRMKVVRSETARQTSFNESLKRRRGARPPAPPRPPAKPRAVMRAPANPLTTTSVKPAIRTDADCRVVTFDNFTSRHHCGWPMADDMWCAEPRTKHFCATHNKIGIVKAAPPVPFRPFKSTHVRDKEIVR